MNALAEVAARDPVAFALVNARKTLPDGSDVTIPDNVAWHCIRDIRADGFAERIEHWARMDAAGPGGATESFSKESLLVAMMASAVKNLPMLATVWTKVLFTGFSPEIREELGIPDPPAEDDDLAWKALYRCVRHRFHRIEQCIDFSELPKNRRRTPTEFEAARRTLTDERKRQRRDRQVWFVNHVVGASHRHLDPAIWARWAGGLAADSTPVPTFARHPRRYGTGKDRCIVTHSADPDAGWYIREDDHADVDVLADGSRPTKIVYAYEHTLIFMAPMSDDEAGLFPKLLLAWAAPHIPGADPGGNAITALAEVAAITDRRGLIAGDNAYVQARPENFALRARSLGWDLVTDYKIDQLGRQGSHEGALLVDGRWYCPAMPEALIDATLDYRRRDIDEKTWERRLADRRAYELRPKGSPAADGSTRMLCPAAGTAPTARCDHKPRSKHRRHASNIRVSLNHLLEGNPPKVCRQQTITIPAEAHDRYGQPLRHETDEWLTAYQVMRSTNEGGNGTAKDSAREDLGEAGRRRIFGQAANALITCFLHYATNLRLILSYAKFAVVDDDGVVRRARKKRKAKHRDLRTHRPTPATGDPPAD